MIRTERRRGDWDAPSAQTDFVSVMRKVKAVDSVAETCSFLFAGTCKGRVMTMAVCCHTYCEVQLTLK